METVSVCWLDTGENGPRCLVGQSHRLLARNDNTHTHTAFLSCVGRERAARVEACLGILHQSLLGALPPLPQTPPPVRRGREAH